MSGNQADRDAEEIESMNYNDRPDGYGFGEAESMDHDKPYENDEHFNDRNYDVKRGYCGRQHSRHGRDWNRWRFVEPYTRDEYGLRNQYGPVDQYSFRDVHVRQWSRPQENSFSEFDLREDFRGRGPKDYIRSDERIYEDICAALFRSDAVDAGKIQVEVREGEVLLRGAVPDRQMRREVEHIVEGLSGVKEIQNQLEVSR
jgi:hypothetical protein